MSLKIAEHELNRFLSTNTPEVMAIKGPWGVGKTFAWRQIVNKASKDKTLALDRYSYVSLFGINSLNDLKQAIFENTLSKEAIGQQPSLESLSKSAASLVEAKSRKWFKYIQGVPLVKDIYSTVQSLSHLLISNQFICIDDLERSGEGLNIKDVMGLANQLKESKGCKIVFLLNENQIEDESFRKLKEKVLDAEVSFLPTTDECLNIVFDDKTIPYYLLARKYCSALNLRNIRVLKKIKKLADMSLSAVSQCHPAVTENLLLGISLFSCSYYCEGTQIPTSNFLRTCNNKLWGFDKDDTIKQEEEWISLLKEIEYSGYDDFYQVIDNSVQAGFLITEDLEREAIVLHAGYTSDNAAKDYSNAWDLFHYTFADNEEILVQTLVAKFTEYIEFLAPNKLNSLVRILRELEKNQLVTEIIDKYIEAHKANKDHFNIPEMNTFGEFRDTELLEKFQRQFNTFFEIKSFTSVLDEIVLQENSWDDEQVQVLAQASKKDFYNIFKSIEGVKLTEYIKACRRFGRIQNSELPYQKIAKASEEALIDISSESRLNKIRVGLYGITAKHEKVKD